MDTIPGPTPFTDPNRYAPPPRVELRGDSVTVSGYQTFLLTKESIRVPPDDPSLQRKQELLANYFRPCHLKGKSVLDLGANAGFFCFWALQNGARRAIALDLDPAYLRISAAAAGQLGFRQLEAVKANVADWNDPCDVVVALSLIHWIYSCTAFFGSLDAAVRRLAQLTRYMLVVEWIAPEDAAIQFFRHLDWSAPAAREPYTAAAFEAALKHHFARYERVGEVSPTRRLYVAFATDDPTQTLCPLPLIRPPDRVVSQRLLAVIDGREYWSRVYELDDVVEKQATDDLAERESQFLSRLSGPYFPRALHARREGGYSVAILERIQGVPLEEAKADLAADAATLHAFFQHCLNILGELKASRITHRDIRVANMLVLESRPVLLDFGWATWETAPYLVPPRLGNEGRPPDGSFSDVHSMGKVFEALNDHRYPVFDDVIALMTEGDPTLRVSDVDVLKTLFAAAAMAGGASASPGGTDDPLPAGGAEAYATAIRALLAQISRRNEELRRCGDASWVESVRVALREIAAVTPEGSLIILVDEDQWGVRGSVSRRRYVPFLERDGEYWGPPPDDATAVAELERLRGAEAAFIVFARPAFWWLEYYAALHSHLRSTFSRILQNDRLVVFDLRESAPP